MQNVKTHYLIQLRELFPDQMASLDASINSAMLSIKHVQGAIGQMMGEVAMTSQSPSDALRELSTYSVVLADLYDYFDSLLHEQDAQAMQTPMSIYDALYRSPEARKAPEGRSSAIDVALKAIAGESLFHRPDAVRDIYAEDRASLPSQIPAVPFAVHEPAPAVTAVDDGGLFDDIPDTAPAVDDGNFWDEADVPVEKNGDNGNVAAGTRPTAYVFRGTEYKFRTYGAALCEVAVCMSRFDADNFAHFCNSCRSDPVFARAVSNEDAVLSQMTSAMNVGGGYYIDTDRDEPELVDSIYRMLSYFGLRPEEFRFVYGNEGG